MRQRAPSHVLRPPTHPKTLIWSREDDYRRSNHYRMIQSIPCLACCHVTSPIVPGRLCSFHTLVEENLDQLSTSKTTYHSFHRTDYKKNIVFGEIRNIGEGIALRDWILSGAGSTSYQKRRFCSSRSWKHRHWQKRPNSRSIRE